MATHIPSTGTHARERSRLASAALEPPRIVAPGGPVSAAVRALRDDAVTHINTARLVRLADSVARLHERLDMMMIATGPALRPALEAMVESLIEALDHLDRDFDIEAENEHGGDIQDEPHDEDSDLEPDDNGIADADGEIEQIGCTLFGTAEELDPLTGERLCIVGGKLVAERWA